MWKASVSIAALLLSSASAVIAADEVTWTGIHVGANVGAGLGQMDLSSETSAAVKQDKFDHSASGVMVGLQFGADWQCGKKLVVGFEADHNIARIGETTQIVFGPNGAPGVGNDIAIETDVNYIQTYRGRIGYAAGRNLFFVTGGMAAMHHNGSAYATLNKAYAADNEEGLHTGEVFGGGYERMVTNKLAVKAEYLRLWSGNNNYVIDLSAAAAEGGRPQLIGMEYRANIVRLGVSFHF